MPTSVHDDTEFVCYSICHIGDETMHYINPLLTLTLTFQVSTDTVTRTVS